MTAKQYLTKVDMLDRMIKNKLSEIYQLKTMACSITVSNDGDRVQKSSDKDRLGSSVVKIVDLERETDDLVDEFVDRRQKIIKQIDEIAAVNLDYYDILSMRYVGKRTFEDIAKNTGWSIRKVFSMHGKALKEFEIMFEKEFS